MTDEEFFEVVRKMRAAQKQYFRTRDVAILPEAKKLEAEVDAEIKARTETPDLF